MILNQKNGIAIRVMQESDYGIMRDYFHYDETMGIGLQVKFICGTRIRQGLSIVVFDEGNKNLLVGIAVAEKMDPKTMEKQHKEAEEVEPNALGRSRKMVAKVEQDANIFERCGVSKYLSLIAISVHASMRGKGLLTQLSVCLMD